MKKEDLFVIICGLAAGSLFVLSHFNAYIVPAAVLGLSAFVFILHYFMAKGGRDAGQSKISFLEWLNGTGAFFLIALLSLLFGYLLQLSYQSSLRYIWMAVNYGSSILAVVCLFLGNVRLSMAIYSYKAGYEITMPFMDASPFGYFNYIHMSVVMIVLALLSLKRYQGKCNQLPFHVLLLLVLFIVFQTIGLFYSSDLKNGFTIAICYMGMLASLIYFSTAVASKDDLLFALRFFLLGFIVIAGFSIHGLSEKIQWTGYGISQALAGLAPNRVSYILGLGIIISLVLAVSRRSILYRLFLFVVAAFFALIVFRSFSRGGIFIILGGTIAFILFSKFHWKYIVLTVILFILLLPVFNYLNEETGGLLQERYRSVRTSRIDIWQKSIDIGMNSPLLGVGTGDSDRILGRVVGKERTHSHNEFARVFAESGLIGLLLYTSWFIAVLHQLNKVRDSHLKGMLWAVFTAGMGSLIFAGLRYGTAHFLICLLVAAAVQLEPQEDNRVR